ncbi:MAG: hypothetical protein VKJ04_04135 [Vampirovibrionales bacterium]|nr:hypothetical protein [Vampirovibrionales bacterium]
MALAPSRIQNTRVQNVRLNEHSIEAFIEAAAAGASCKPLLEGIEGEDLANEDVSSSITQTWTDQAIKCHVTKADCANCSIPRGGYSFVCQMNKVVPVLLKNLGEPDARKVEKLTPYLHC